MMKVSQTRLLEARRLFSVGEYKKGLEVVAQVPTDEKWTASELLLKARLILLGDNESRWSLASVQAILEQALDMEPTSVPALLELGFFYSRTMDEPARARPCFEQAIALCRQRQLEALEGMFELLEDLEGSRAATCYILQENQLLADRIRRLVKASAGDDAV